MRSKKFTIILIISLLFLSIISMFIGVIPLQISQILQGNMDQLELVLISRLPRLLAIICTGMGMSVAGLLMQQLCMNKFVSPSTGATISSAQFGILLAMIYFPHAGLVNKSIFAFITAMLGTGIFVYFIQKIRYKDTVLVPLVGIMFGNIIAGITDYISYKYELNQTLSAWLVGDFSMILRGRYEIVFLVVPLLVIAFIFANYFNVIAMGENMSKNLGIPYNVILLLGLIISSLITASIVVTVGSISYIGLIIPNLVAIFKGDRIRGNIIDVALSGSIFVLVCDMIGRMVNAPYEMPIELVIGIIGSLLFLVLLVRRISPRLNRKKSVAHTLVGKRGES